MANSIFIFTLLKKTKSFHCNNGPPYKWHHSTRSKSFLYLEIFYSCLNDDNQWVSICTHTSRKAANLIDTTASMSLHFIYLSIFFFCTCRLVCACASLPTVCLWERERARAEMRPVCLLLSQIAPMRDPKITTKSPQWVGWKPCHQPFQHRESPPLLYLWVTPHTSHEDRKGRQSLVFDRNKYFHMLMRLLLAFSRGGGGGRGKWVLIVGWMALCLLLRGWCTLSLVWVKVWMCREHNPNVYANMSFLFSCFFFFFLRNSSTFW